MFRTWLTAVSDFFVRFAEAIEADPLDGLETRIARLERAAAAGGEGDVRQGRPAAEELVDQASA